VLLAWGDQGDRHSRHHSGDMCRAHLDAAPTANDDLDEALPAGDVFAAHDESACGACDPARAEHITLR